MIYHAFESLAKIATIWMGSTISFVLAVTLIIGWLLAGFYFNFSDSHSLFINTVTTIITFLMVFLIQRAHNKDSLALHLKLNELIAAQTGASNRILNIENLSEKEVYDLQKRYQLLANKVVQEPLTSHSVEEVN